MEWIISQRGKRLLVLDNYRFRKVRKANDGWKWRCTKKTCNASLILDESEVKMLESDLRHNHEPSKRLIMMKERKDVLKNTNKKPRVKKVETPPPSPSPSTSLTPISSKRTRNNPTQVNLYQAVIDTAVIKKPRNIAPQVTSYQAVKDTTTMKKPRNIAPQVNGYRAVKDSELRSKLRSAKLNECHNDYLYEYIFLEENLGKHFLLQNDEPFMPHSYYETNLYQQPTHV